MDLLSSDILLKKELSKIESLPNGNIHLKKLPFGACIKVLYFERFFRNSSQKSFANLAKQDYF
jgi:hypothetical protein